ncbi:hypothetical protein [Streptomyces sp. NPDC093097]|uniref:hypothetical protein n=1 Tax=Streptomyces sp. NPDC093097 TaxID=3366027 RepID=UPI00382C46D8
MSPTTTPPRPHFASWRDVPDGIYATETQLKTMDLPRRPGLPAATVKARDGAGLVSARAKGIPSGPLDPQAGYEQLTDIVATRTVLVWNHDALADLNTGLTSQIGACPVLYEQARPLEPLATAWRG